MKPDGAKQFGKDHDFAMTYPCNQCIAAPMCVLHTAMEMTVDKFDAGDVVTLKSGSPNMAIRWIEDGEAYCDWFAGTEAKGAKFALVQLDKIKPVSAYDAAQFSRLT